ncbi:helix-turn-helix domain-containing protein [Amycolatopsis methanolica]|uniref:helix-turn-helix domain-containing protein n=1 Tax=Amycolatopsis methanolica TaxID=1814 RepID=UPI000475D804|nr:helix-turn-helix domain-containing protein [Amycolatopsis methanolica]
MAEGRVVGGAGLQTLERGLAVLEAVAEHAPCTTATIAEVTGLHRSIAYRVLCTLEAHGYLQRDPAGRYEVGLAVLTVASAVRSDPQSLAHSALTPVAEATGTVAFLAVPHGEEALTLVTVEPPAAAGPVSYRRGVYHPITRGAPGIGALAVPVALRAGRVASACVLFVPGRLGEEAALTGLHAAAAQLAGR